VVSQPAGQRNAVVGGIMAMRMARLGARGVLVDGRVRDLSTLAEVGMPVSLLYSHLSNGMWWGW
jgi:regulator of RNase E activity RraA